jgi:signal transduction histidine kinase/ActR/RegA family two-component response regulator
VQQNSAANRRASAPRVPWRQAVLHGNRLARRVLVLVVLFSSAITAAITGLELYGEYRRDLRAIDGAFQFVASRYLPSLVNSVWNVDEVQVQSQLDALVGLPDVEYIAVEESGRARWSAGRAVSQRTKELRLPLRHGDAAASIGQLHVVASVDRVLARLWEHLVEVLLANAVKTLLVATFLLICFQVLITQHLNKTARYLSEVDLRDPAPPRPLELERPRGGFWRPDILDTVVDATNSLLHAQHALREQLVRSQADLADSEAHQRMRLEATVRERTLALEQARDEAERASRAKSDFLSRMSHELRTPMNAMLGFAQLIELSGGDPKLQRWAHEICAAGEHLLKLIEDLLDLSRIEAGKVSVQIVPLELPPLLDEALRIVQAALPQQGTRFERRLLPGLPPVAGDIVRLKQILVNLLTNAAKYTPGGGRIIVAAERRSARRVRVAVSDEGMGIARDQIERLFQPFERLGREATGIEGTGVGLALSKRLADLMGCELGVDSREGQGSTFWLDVPVAPHGADATAPTQPAATRTAARPMRVLYVEDNATNRAVMQAFFQSQPAWQLLLADDGESGLALARRERPDVIVLDLHLPDRDGHSVLQALRADPATAAIPALALTADARPEERERGLHAGFSAYLTKPVVFEELVAALERTPAAAMP